MTAGQWGRISEIFDAAVDFPPGEAEAYLREACSGDQALYSEVRRMLDECAREGVLDQSPWTETHEEASLQPGRILAGRYRIVRFLGRGGMGEVYEADDSELRERVALKTLLPRIALDRRMITRFKHEIQLARRIAHPNVCRVFDLARDPVGNPVDNQVGKNDPVVYFLTMELLAGETLSARLTREGIMDKSAALPVLRQVAAALDAAHGAAVIHRDLKPSNIMLVGEGGDVRAVVTDFGLARSFRADSATATTAGQLAGTFDYMAPELFQGQAASVASDVYALGMVAGRMVGGILPRSDDPTRTQIDPAWQQAIRRATDPDPSRRFASAGDFAGALNQRIRSFPRLLAGGLAAVLLAGIAGAAWRSHRSSPTPSAEAMSFYRKGTDDIQGGAFYAATRALDEAIRVTPQFPLAHARMAQTWQELQVPEKAAVEMLLARRGDLNSLPGEDRLRLEAIDLTVTREFAAAVRKYESIRQRAEDPEIDMDLGRAYEEANRPDKAIESYRRAAEGNAHSPAAWLRLGALDARLGRPDQATDAFGKAEKGYQLESNLEGLTQVALERGLDANRNSRLEEESRLLLSALSTARVSGNVQQEISATLQLARNAQRQGDAPLAERYAKEGLDLARSSQMEVMAVDGLFKLGNAYRLKQEFTEAERYYREGTTLAEREKAWRLAATGIESLAAVHDQMSRPAEAIQEARQALAYFEPGGYAYESALALGVIGREQEKQGDAQSARATYQHLLQLSEKSGNNQGIARAHALLGALLANAERYPEALQEISLELKAARDPETRGFADLWIGALQWKQGRYDEAETAFGEAAPAEARYPRLHVGLIREKAEMEISRQRYSQAAALAREVLHLAHEDQEAFAASQRVLGLALIALGSSEEGLRLCTQSVADERKRGDPDGIGDALTGLIFAQVQVGRPAEAKATLAELEPALATRPDTRWRILAQMTRLDAHYRTEARHAFDDYSALWPAGFTLYLSRPDIRPLALAIQSAGPAPR